MLRLCIALGCNVPLSSNLLYVGVVIRQLSFVNDIKSTSPESPREVLVFLYQYT